MDIEHLNAIADQLAVRTVLDEYSLRLEIDEFDRWLDLFTDDTVYDVFGRSLVGREAVAAMLSQAPHGVHLGGASRIVISGDEADTVQNYVFVSTSSDEWNIGWYHRKLVRQDGVWKIAHTRVKLGRKDPMPQNDRARHVTYPIRFA